MTLLQACPAPDHRNAGRNFLEELSHEVDHRFGPVTDLMDWQLDEARVLQRQAARQFDLNWQDKAGRVPSKYQREMTAFYKQHPELSGGPGWR